MFWSEVFAVGKVLDEQMGDVGLGKASSKEIQLQVRLNRLWPTAFPSVFILPRV
jgi:hypothetical protein